VVGEVGHRRHCSENGDRAGWAGAADGAIASEDGRGDNGRHGGHDCHAGGYYREYHDAVGVCRYYQCDREAH